MTALGPLPPIACIAPCPQLEKADATSRRREETTRDCPGSLPQEAALRYSTHEEKKSRQTERANITFSSWRKKVDNAIFRDLGPSCQIGYVIFWF
jgi:hypothetical protein